MTSEICLMNNLSVVLAADSATTVEYVEKGKSVKRYFKGANKIFQLSNKQPVGLMIYNSASLINVPWEVTIKEFRRELGDKNFNSIDGFSEEFIEYVDQNLRFFPEDNRRAEFLRSVTNTAIFELVSLNRSKKADEKVTLASYLDTLDASFNFDLEKVEISQDDKDELFAACADELNTEIRSWLKTLQLKATKPVIERAIVLFFNKALMSLAADGNYTGMVFAGFGDHSVFPEMISYDRCNLRGTRFVASGKKRQCVDYDVPAVIEGFAQTSMTDTFSVGLSFEIFATAQNAFAEEMHTLAKALNEKLTEPIEEAELRKMIAERLDGTKQKIFQYAQDHHTLPLRRVLGALPVDEMAELAETLINLQSLKEKVTRPSESVGGPVDVAAVTRSEGLVWIKRKHFFDPKLNSRYFERSH